jgi:hypothetical protein
MNEPATERATVRTAWSAPWAQAPAPEPGTDDADLVVRLMYQDYQNLLALEAALCARRGDLPRVDGD